MGFNGIFDEINAALLIIRLLKNLNNPILLNSSVVKRFDLCSFKKCSRGVNLEMGPVISLPVRSSAAVCGFPPQGCWPGSSPPHTGTPQGS